MQKSKFTDSQVMEALKRVEAVLSVPEICWELGISSATFYKWRSKYGGMDAPNATLQASSSGVKAHFGGLRLADPAGQFRIHPVLSGRQ